MKTVQFSVRLNKTEHEKIKLFSRRSGFCISQILRDIINGKRCLCDEHALRQLIDSPEHTSNESESSFNNYQEDILFNLKLSFENLMLLRLFVQRQSPELIEQARQQRIHRFGLDENNIPKENQ